MLQTREAFGTTAPRSCVRKWVYLFHDRCVVILAYFHQVWLLPCIQSQLFWHRGSMTCSAWAWTKRQRGASPCGGGVGLSWQHDWSWCIEGKLNNNWINLNICDGGCWDKEWQGFLWVWSIYRLWTDVTFWSCGFCEISLTTCIDQRPFANSKDPREWKKIERDMEINEWIIDRERTTKEKKIEGARRDKKKGGRIPESRTNGSELSGGELRRSDWFDHKVTK